MTISPRNWPGQADPLSPLAPRPTPLAPTEEPIRVLITEDDPFTLKILQKRLLMGGYTVATATNGEDGLNQVGIFKPDLVISDWMMPGTDGREFCRRLKSNPATRPIYFILLTARDKHEDMVAALDTGADEYLVKPCDGQELMARLRAAERILRLRQELSNSNEQLQQALKRINTELEATSHIQRSLLPRQLPAMPGYQFAAHYQPSTECSGDFYDLLPLGPDQLGLAIGDVSGHGTPAMVTMALTHLLLHQEARRQPDPASLLVAINEQMCAYLPTEQYLTMFFGILNLSNGELTYSSAGHNPPLLADAIRQTYQFLPHCEGFPIKLIGPGLSYDNYTVQLLPGQQLILYTDGLLEAYNPRDQLYGQSGMLRSVASAGLQNAQGLLDLLLTDRDQHLQGQPPEDDLSLLIVQRG